MGTANSYSNPPAERPVGASPAINGFSVVQRRLMGLERLPASDLAQIQALETAAHCHERGVDILVEGDDHGPLYIQVDGWACRYRLIEDGRRQILDFVLPGDWYDLTASEDLPYTASIGMVTPSLAAATPPGFRRRCAEAHPRLLEAIEAMRGEAVRRLEAQVTMLGRLSACEAMLMFVSRTFRRLAAVGLVEDNGAPFPLTQETLGDHLGLSTVHVNRTLKVLKEEWGVRVADGRLTIADPAAVHTAVSDTDPGAHRLPS